MSKKSGIVWLIVLSLANGILLAYGVMFTLLQILGNSVLCAVIISAIGGVFRLFKKSFLLTTFVVGLILLVLNVIGAIGKYNMGLA